MKERNSVLRSTSPSSLIQFKMKDVKEEIVQNAPAFQVCCNRFVLPRGQEMKERHIYMK